jgi:hypothetical protein
MQARRRRFPRCCHRTNGGVFEAAHTVQRRRVDRSKKIHLHFTTDQSLRTNRKDITYDQHPDHQFRIN